MLSKIDKHHVDCDIKPLTPTEWDWEFGGNYGAYSLTVYAENGGMWLAPVYNRSVQYINANEDAVPLDGGLVGIPYNGHPYSAGDVIRISGATQYPNQYTVHANTTTNQVVITAGYVAKTFAGTEIIQQFIDTTTSLGRSEQDSSGNIYLGHQYANGTHLTKVSPDGTQTYDFFVPSVDWPWPAGGNSVCGLKITDDEQYIYCHFNTNKRIYKFNLSTGAQEWCVALGSNSIGYQLEVDSDGNAYVANSSDAKDKNAYSVAKYAAADGAKTNYTSTHGAFAIWIDDELAYDGTTGVILSGGQGVYQPASPSSYFGYNLFIRTMDNAKGKGVRLGDWASEAGGFQYTRIIGSHQIQVYEGYIYVLLIGSSGTMYKLNTDLEIQVEKNIDNSRGFYFDLFGNLVVVVNPGTAELHFYDTDLEFVSSIDGFYSGFIGTWGQNNFYEIGSHHFFSGFENPTAYLAPGSHQYRTTSYPSDWTHLEGQTVQVVKDGIYLGDEAVSGGQITLDD